MKNKGMVKILIAVMVLALSLSTFAACSGEAEAAHVGTLVVKVNPEFGVNYDIDGNVTSIDARNDDAAALLEGYTGYEGRPSREVVKELVALMNDAGYFATDVEGEGRKITIQVEPESQLPGANFLQDVVTDVKGYFSDKQITGQIAIEGESNYGMSEYAVSDYGEVNFKTVKNTVASGTARYTDYANTDYDGYNTDYGSNTDYDGKLTDYDPDGASDYDGYNTNYGESTDYDGARTDYYSGGSSSGGGTSSSGSSSGGGTSSGGSSSSGNTGYSSGGTSSSGSSSSGNSGYDSSSGNSGYDSNSGYDD